MSARRLDSGPAPTYAAVVVTDDHAWARHLTSALAPAEDIRLLRILDAEGLREFLRSRDPAVVLLDFSCAPAVAVWQGVSTGRLPMIAFGDAEDPELLRLALRQGAHDYLAKSASVREVAEGIYRAGADLQRITPGAPGAPAHGKIIAVASLRGGVGRSTVSVNTAAALQLRAGSKSVGLWDLNLTVAASEALLGVKPPRPLEDMMTQLQRLDPEFFLTFFAQHRSGLRVLPPPAPGTGPDLQTREVGLIAGALRDALSFSVIDTSAAFTEPDFAAVEAADLVLLVVTPDMLSLKAAIVYLDEMQVNHVVRSKHVLVLNGFDRHAAVRRRDVEEALSLPVWGEIPFDRPAFLRAVNTGAPLVGPGSRSRAGKAFTALASRILSMEVSGK